MLKKMFGLDVLEKKIDSLSDTCEVLLEENRKLKELVQDSRDKLYRGDWEIHQNLKQYLYQQCGQESALFILENMNNVKAFNRTLDILTYGYEKASVDGMILEFGVYQGGTINHIASLTKQKVYGFDSFEGLPENWRSGFEKSTFAVTEIPDVRENVELVKGWFDVTLPKFLEKHEDEKVKLLHVDCDLYSSTKTIFANLRSKIVPGTVIVFDEFFNYPGWKDGEYKAFMEFIDETGYKFEYLGYVEIMEQVAVRIV